MPRKQQAEYLEDTRQGRKIIAERTESEKAWSQLPIAAENLPLWASFILIMSNMVAAAEHVNAQTKHENGTHNHTGNALTPATTHGAIADANQALQASLFQTLQEFGKQPIQFDMFQAIKQINTHIKDTKAQTWVKKFAKENKNATVGLNALREAISMGQFELADTFIELGVTVDLITPGETTPLVALTNLAQHEEYKPFKKEMKQLFHKIANRESAFTPHPILPDEVQKKSFLAKLYHKHSHDHFAKHMKDINRDEIDHFHASFDRIKSDRIEVPIDAYYSEVMLEGRIYYIRYSPDGKPLVTHHTNVLTLSPMLKNLMSFLTKPAANIKEIKKILQMPDAEKILVMDESILFAVRHVEVLELLKPTIKNFSPVGYFHDTPLAREIHLAAIAAREFENRTNAKYQPIAQSEHQEKMLFSDNKPIKNHLPFDISASSTQHNSISTNELLYQQDNNIKRVFEIIEFYLKNGASLNEKNALGEPLIFDLLMSGDKANYQFIKDYPVDLTVTNRIGATPLNFYLRSFAGGEFASTLIDMSPDSVINQPDNDGTKPIEHALWAGQEKLCEKLMDRWANLESDKELIQAIENGDDENKKAMLARLRKKNQANNIIIWRWYLRTAEAYISLFLAIIPVVVYFYARYFKARRTNDSFQGVAQLNQELTPEQLKEKDKILQDKIADINIVAENVTNENQKITGRIDLLRCKREEIKCLIEAYLKELDIDLKPQVLSVIKKLDSTEDEFSALKNELLERHKVYQSIGAKKYIVKDVTEKSYTDTFAEIDLAKKETQKEVDKRKDMFKRLELINTQLMEHYNNFIDCIFRPIEIGIAKNNAALDQNKQQLQKLIKLPSENLDKLRLSCLTLPNQVNAEIIKIPANYHSEEIISSYNDIKINCANEYDKLSEIKNEIAKFHDTILPLMNQSGSENKSREKANFIETKEGIDIALKIKDEEKIKLEELNNEYSTVMHKIKKINDSIISKMTGLKEKQNKFEKIIKDTAKQVELNEIVKGISKIQAKPNLEKKEEQAIKAAEVVKAEPRKKTEEEKRIEKERRKAAAEAKEQNKLKEEDEERKKKERDERIKKQAELANFLREREPLIAAELKNLNQIKEYLNNLSLLKNIKFFTENRFFNIDEGKENIAKKTQFFALLYALIRIAEYLDKLHEKFPFFKTRIAFNDHNIRNNLMHRGFYLNRQPEVLLEYAEVLSAVTVPALNQLLDNTLVEKVKNQDFNQLSISSLYGNEIRNKEEDVATILANIRDYLNDMKLLVHEIKNIDDPGKSVKFAITNDLQYAAKGVFLSIAQRLRDLHRFAPDVYREFYQKLSHNNRTFIQKIFSLRNDIGHAKTEKDWDDEAMGTLYYYEEIQPFTLKEHCLQVNDHLKLIFDFQPEIKKQPYYTTSNKLRQDVFAQKDKPPVAVETKKEKAESSSDEEQYFMDKFGL